MPKTFLAFLVAFSCVSAHFSALGGGGMNRRRILATLGQSGGMPTAADYQGELIALWDGIENVADGQHDGSSTEWVDLIGGRRATLTAHGSWAADALVCDGVGYAAKDGLPFARADVGCVEVVFEAESNGLVYSLSDRGSLSGGGEIYLRRYDSYAILMGSESSSAGFVNNIARTLDNVSLSAVYSTNNLIGARVNGVEITPNYRFGTASSNNVDFGGRSSFTDYPFAGKIKCVRVFSSITDAQRAANYAIDKARFGLT